MLGIAQGIHNFHVKFACFCIDHSHGSSIGVLPRLDTAELPHKVLRHHQQIGDPFQPAVDLLVIKLIDGIERLELAAASAVQFGERHFLMDLWNHRFRAAVPIGIDGINLLVAFQKHIVHTPGVDGQAFNLRILPEGFQNAAYYVGEEFPNIPC